MRRQFIPLFFALHTLLCPHPAVRAQSGTGIALGPGRVLQAGALRQVSLNAHVSGFLFQPGGLSVAFVGARDEDGRRTVTAWFADARREAPARALFRVTGDGPGASTQEPHIPGIDLIGWTPDARYLLLRRFDQISLQAQYVSVDVGVEPFHTRILPDLGTPGDGIGLPGTAWSPDGRRLLMTASGIAQVYNPASDTTLPVAVPGGCLVWGWRDAGHLLFLRPAHGQDGKTTFLLHDLATGTDSEVPSPAPWPPADGVAVSLPFTMTPIDPTTPAAPGLTLETKTEHLSDARNVAGTQATAIWVRRTGAPKAMSAVAIGVTPGPDDPQAAWSPKGNAIAFVAHGDLFVADLAERNATPDEKVAAGEKLDCDEERAIVESNLKQVGLGFLQYTQDNDENFPPAGGWHDAVGPYIGSAKVFDFAGIPVVYHAPANRSLAALESPAVTVLATADTPCAHIVLYADGHVKSYDKQGNPFSPRPRP